MRLLTLADPEKALLRSQSGPDAGVELSVAPINFLTRIDASLFRVLLRVSPMWPSIGFLWPPSCSRVVGKEELRR